MMVLESLYGKLNGAGSILIHGFHGRVLRTVKALRATWWQGEHCQMFHEV